jgi:hypothetical protein
LDSALNFDSSLPASKLGPTAREAIYYGADSFYLHQFEHFGRDRYREDFEWLIQNVGISARPMVKIARFVLEHISQQMAGIHALTSAGKKLDKGDLTNSLLISKDDLARTFGSKAEAFLRKFTTPATNANAAFDAPFTVNQVNLAPLIGIPPAWAACTLKI